MTKDHGWYVLLFISGTCMFYYGLEQDDMFRTYFGSFMFAYALFRYLRTPGKD